MFHVKHITAINTRIIAHFDIKNKNNTSTYAIKNYIAMFFVLFYKHYGVPAIRNFQLSNSTKDMFHVKHYINYFIKSNNSQLGKYSHY